MTFIPQYYQDINKTKKFEVKIKVLLLKEKTTTTKGNRGVVSNTGILGNTDNGILGNTGIASNTGIQGIGNSGIVRTTKFLSLK